MNAVPGARRLIESLRDIGYECPTAIADLIDNSLAADSSEVHVDIFPQDGKRPAFISISDNGRGMDRDTLREAMRFGSLKEYSPEDLGKYGLGLKTASLSQCRVLTVASKPKSKEGTRPRRHVLRWDLDHVFKTDAWDLQVPEIEELEDWQTECVQNALSEEGGTTVVWCGLEETYPYLCGQSSKSHDRELASLIEEIGSHLRMVFHRFMQGAVPGRRKLKIFLCEEALSPWDPFCGSEKTEELPPHRLTIPVTGKDGKESISTITVIPYVLPRENEFSSTAAWKDAGGPKRWNQHQGFYFYRNNRLMRAGGWSNLRQVDEHTKLLRISLSFPSELDHVFNINITKMRARIPVAVRSELEKLVSRWAAKARTRYDGTTRKQQRSTKPVSKKAFIPAPKDPAPPPAVRSGPVTFNLSGTGSGRMSVIKGGEPGQIKVVIPNRHPASAVFGVADNDKGDLVKLCVGMFSVLQSVFDKKLKPSEIPLDSFEKALRKLL